MEQDLDEIEQDIERRIQEGIAKGKAALENRNEEEGRQLARELTVEEERIAKQVSLVKTYREQLWKLKEERIAKQVSLVKTYREQIWKLKEAKPECRIKDDDQQCSNNTDVTELREFAENEPVLVIKNKTGPSHCLSKKDAEAILNTSRENPYTRKPLHPASLRDFVETLNKEGGNYCNQGRAMRREGQRRKRRKEAQQQAQPYWRRPP